MDTQNENIAVSVICATYNQENYVRDMLDGLVSQKTNFRFEIVVHDDASPDGTADIIREYAEKYPDLIRPILRTENQYQKNKQFFWGVCREYGRGKYFAFCEGDDYWTDPLKLQKQYDFMESHPDYSLCCCSSKWLDQLSGKIGSQGVVDHDKDISLEEMILEKNGRIFLFVSDFVRKECVDTLPDWGFPIGDYPFAVHAAMNGKIHMLADSMCTYRYHAAGSWTQRMQGDEQRRRTNEQMIKGLENMNRTTGGKYEKLINQRILRHRYTDALLSHDFQAIRKDPQLYERYRSRGLIYRISDRLHCASPKLFYMVNKLLKRSE